jgi:integrase
MKRERHQSGSVVLNDQGTAFYIRFRVGEIGKDGQPVRKQKYERLCERDAEHYSTKCKAVKQAAADFMAKINAAKSTDRMTVDTFWTTHYLPWARGNYRKYTLAVMEQYYAQYIKERIGNQFLSELRPSQAQLMLEELGKKHAKSTIGKVKQICASIFQRAVIPHEILSVNPWYQVRLKGIHAQSTPDKQFYTLDETLDVIEALNDDTEAALLFALSGIMALRPEETAALRWDDLANGRLFIQRTVIKGEINDTKTQESKNSLPIIEPVGSLFAAWYEQCSRQPWWPGAGWVFPNSEMQPLYDIQEFARKRIRDVIVPKGLPWKTLYGGRRGAITTTIDLTNGNIHAGQELARHKNATITLGRYKQTTGVNVQQAVKVLEGKIKLLTGGEQ